MNKIRQVLELLVEHDRPIHSRVLAKQFGGTSHQMGSLLFWASKKGWVSRFDISTYVITPQGREHLLTPPVAKDMPGEAGLRKGSLAYNTLILFKDHPFVTKEIFLTTYGETDKYLAGTNALLRAGRISRIMPTVYRITDKGKATLEEMGETAA